MSFDIRIQNNVLHLGEHIAITFQRTLRIPDDGRTYPLPPGLGAFPIRRVADYEGKLPADMERRGGVFIPMFQREAMWMSFSGAAAALKVGVGKVCAITGRLWDDELTNASTKATKQNYVVLGSQPWLDGIATGKGTIRQFIAMPLGSGYTVEGQVTGEETWGGIQLRGFLPRPGDIPMRVYRVRSAELAMAQACAAPSPLKRRSKKAASAMGLGAGGRMKQKIYRDPHGLGAAQHRAMIEGAAGGGRCARQNSRREGADEARESA
jgi:hypothetical protein